MERKGKVYSKGSSKTLLLCILLVLVLICELFFYFFKKTSHPQLIQNVVRSTYVPPNITVVNGTVSGTIATDSAKRIIIQTPNGNSTYAVSSSTRILTTIKASNKNSKLSSPYTPILLSTGDTVTISTSDGNGQKNSRAALIEINSVKK